MNKILENGWVMVPGMAQAIQQDYYMEWIYPIHWDYQDAGRVGEVGGDDHYRWNQNLTKQINHQIVC